MASSERQNRRVSVPKCHYILGGLLLAAFLTVLLLLDARASDFDTLASALGLYSAALLGVFSVLNSWRTSIVGRAHRYQQVEDKWRSVIDRSVIFALRGSALSFMLMLFGVVAPAVKMPILDLVGGGPYAIVARVTSSVAISGVVALGLISMQIVRDITAVYDWNNKIEQQDSITRSQLDGPSNF